MKHIASKMILIFLLLLQAPAQIWAEEQKRSEDGISSFLHRLFEARTQLLIHNTPNKITSFYLPKEKASRFALLHEQQRAKYLHAWAKKREVTFTEAKGSIRIARIKSRGDTAEIFLLHTLKLTYRYTGQSKQTHSFGIGTRHSIKLKKIQGAWHVAREWYLDPIEENPYTIPSDSVKNPFPMDSSSIRDEKQNQTSFVSKRRFNREKAINYANKYAGAAWGAGNNHRYNPKYLDYHYNGGDCTNFASQVIGDPEEGGGLPMRGDWYYRYKQGGNTAWVQTDSFKHFLIRSGYGKQIAKGYYADVMTPTPSHPQGALARLQPGDLIGYEINGDIDHFSIVTGRDSNGYVFVNSHTGDRYHVPWDLGWDQYTKFVLIHIND
ncbi:amidase domain-containing protein [Aneurinibacillus thermoaerophilus]|uniref:amidase domain-containing protein n=1 Tax=Aneurinibacillus thermoaerophilus TaxID=143495 RepID=UPI002E1A0A02|nr:amidase domain-containing protein [Aneurinibacillus thermoaerophilus]MED0766350.1 amidase domain-containing protein [Aneurinibacillus thermoaerophilus]